MIKSRTNTQIKLANSEEDYEIAYRLRKAVFGQEQGYSEECLKLDRYENQYYVLCSQDGKPTGTVTAELSEKSGYLDIDKYYDLTQYYSTYRRLIFWSRIAVLKEYRNSLTSPLLYMIMYKLSTKLDAGYMIVDCKENNEISKSLIPKIGFKPIGRCVKGEIGPVIVWGATLNDYTQAIFSYIERKGLGDIFQKYFNLSKHQLFFSDV